MGSLQTRLLLTYMLIIFVTLGLTAAGLFFVLGGYRDTISYSNLDDVAALINVQAEAQIAAGAPDNPDQPIDPQRLLLLLSNFIGRVEEGGSDASVMVIDGAGTVIQGPYSGAAIERPPDQPATVDGQPYRCRLTVPDLADLLCVATPLTTATGAPFEGTGAVALVVAKPATDLGEVVGDLLPRLAFAGLIGLAAALAMGFLLSQSVAAPLRRIARAARGVARGNYTQRVPLTGPREVREVATNFNRMTEEVQRSQQTLRDFLMNISHEIKTPLTSIRGFSQAVMDGTIDDTEGVSRSARIINDESTRVLRLVEELLDLSRLESGQSLIRQEDVELTELFDHVGEVFALRSEETGVKLDIPRPVGVRVRGDFDRLEQVLNNLLDNAFRHTPEGGAVAVATRPTQQGLVQISVRDTGKGIPPEDVPHLFERFYRAANGRNTKGYGLGLAITREIVRAHGGDIWATSDAGRGTTFSFTLPVANPATTPARPVQSPNAAIRASSG